MEERFDGQLPSDVGYMRTMIVNVCMIGVPGSGRWTLIDAGIAGYADEIEAFAGERFGSTKPEAIVLTHGHFDHIGSLQALMDRWQVPVYAHRMELPYLTGEADYLPGDPSVGGGLMARVAPLYPHQGVRVTGELRALPEDGTVPSQEDWQWIATPGHTEGHVSLFRGSDRALIAGDAFITVKQESALSVLTQHKEIHGPPAYFTPNWDTAWESVRRLAALKPACAITGHGKPMSGAELAEGLERLARDFDQMAIPEHGRYVRS